MLLMTGASGHIGRRAAELLGETLPSRGRGSLRLMTRTPEKLQRPSGVEVVYGDFASPQTLEPAFRGVDVAAIISSSAPPDERAIQQRNAFHAAAQAGVRHLIYVSLQGSGPQSRFSYSRDHDTSERFLADCGVPETTILRNAFYLDMLPGFIAEDGVLRNPSSGGRAAFVSREDAARTLAAVLTHPPGGIHEVTGPEAISVADAVARLARLTGRTLRYEAVRSKAQSAAAGPEAEGWRTDLYTGWFEAVAAGELEHVSPAVRQFTSRDPLTLEQYFSAFPQALGLLRPQGGDTPAR